MIDVAGVGYRIVVPPATAVALGPVGDDVVVHTHLHVREDALSVFGFATAEARDCFESLLGAHGVGPGLALAILDVHGPGELRRLVFAGSSSPARLRRGRRDAEVRAALAGLGYQPDGVRLALGDLPADGDVQSLVPSALQTLGAPR